MSHGLSAILSEMERLAEYEGPWRTLRDEAPLLRERVRELRDRETRLDDLLVVALVGGSGVGKSTLLNALAGDQLAATSEMRPCTSVPTVYQPPGADFGLDVWNRVYGSALEHLVIIDTPDSDTVAREHRQTVIQALEGSDLIFLCGSPDKYLDEATWSLLRPLQGERTIVCVETKSDLAQETIREHWLERLEEQGFSIARYFKVSPRRTLDRKLGASRVGDEYDFPELEAFLREELTVEQARRIKRSNAVGLFTKTLARLRGRVGSQKPTLESLRERLAEIDKTLAREVCDHIAARLFAEPHLWNFALGRETSVRAKGVVGTLFRVLEAIRTLPTRIGGAFSWGVRSSTGRQAATMLSEADAFASELDIESPGVRALFDNRRSEATLDYVRAGFDAGCDEDEFGTYAKDLGKRIGEVLRGPARERVVARARLMTSWPSTLLADAVPVAFIGFAGYRIVGDYFAGITLTSDYFLHAATVLAILIGVEMVLYSALCRMLAWTARRGAAHELRLALLSGGIAFRTERSAVDDAIGAVNRIESLGN